MEVWEINTSQQGSTSLKMGLEQVGIPLGHMTAIRLIVSDVAYCRLPQWTSGLCHKAIKPVHTVPNCFHHVPLSECFRAVSIIVMFTKTSSCLKQSRTGSLHRHCCLDFWSCFFLVFFNELNYSKTFSLLSRKRQLSRKLSRKIMVLLCKINAQ